MSVIKGLTLAGAEGFDYSRFIAGVGSGIEQEGYNAGYITPDVGMPSFALIFKDLGAGVVDVKPLVGAVAATFTRATTSTTILPTGLIGSVASGSPRSYYDPTSLAYLGYLAEGSRINLCLQSEVLGTTWAPTRASISTNATTAPDGAVTADKIVEDATAANTHALQQTIAGTVNSAPITISMWFKGSTRTKGQLQLASVPTTATSATVPFDLTAGTVSAVVNAGTAATTSATITSYPSSWYRITLTTTLTNAEVSAIITIFLADAAGAIIYNGDGASGFFAWGGQLEAASFASSYMPTTVASFTRNADVLTYLLAAGAAGTLFTSYTNLNVAAGAFAPWALYTDSNNYLTAYRSTTGSAFDVVNGGVAQANISQAATQAVGNEKMVSAWAVNDFALVNDGGAVGTDSSGTIPSVTTLSVGIVGFGAGSSHLFGPISRIAYFPPRLPDYILRQLTS